MNVRGFERMDSYSWSVAETWLVHSVSAHSHTQSLGSEAISSKTSLSSLIRSLAVRYSDWFSAARWLPIVPATWTASSAVHISGRKTTRTPRQRRMLGVEGTRGVPPGSRRAYPLVGQGLCVFPALLG